MILSPSDGENGAMIALDRCLFRFWMIGPVQEFA